jgi:hypothetical protein
MTKNIIGLMLLMSSLTFTETRAQGNNDFKIDVKVTQGIEDAGYLVQVFDRNQSARKFLGKIDVVNKRSAFETHLDEPLVGDLTAIFPNGEVCTACVRFPFVPGEECHVKVKNGTFELTGTTFYQQWADADDLEENAHKYYKQWETDSIILNYFKKHANEEGCVMRYWQYEVLPRPTILKLIPDNMRNGRFKSFFDQHKEDYVAAIVLDKPDTVAVYDAEVDEDEVEVEEPEEIDVIEMPDVSDISFNFDFDSNAPKMSRRQMKKAIKKQMKELEKQMTKYMIEMQKHIEKMGQKIEKRS